MLNAIINKLIPTKWQVCFVGSLFFLYQFIQENIFNSISSEMAEQFNLNAIDLGLLSSSYFYATVALVLPAGQILDRFSTKKTILSVLAICLFAVAIFSISNNLFISTLCRFISGLGGAFCFLGSFKLASRWFPKEKMGFVTGIVIMIGMMGGVLAQTPFAVLTQLFGWRKSMLVNFALGALVYILILLLVKDGPIQNNVTHEGEQVKLGYLSSLKLSYLSLRNWFFGIYTCFLNLPIVILGALWGNLYLEKAHGFGKTNASLISSMIFIGTIIGSPLVGLISDRLRSRKLPMIFGGILSIMTILAITFLKENSMLIFMLLFFMLGLFTSSQILGYPAAADKQPAAVATMSASVVSLITMCGFIIFQPLFGYLIDLFSGLQIAINSKYIMRNYDIAILIIPVCFLVALATILFIREDDLNKNKDY